MRRFQLAMSILSVSYLDTKTLLVTSEDPLRHYFIEIEGGTARQLVGGHLAGSIRAIPTHGDFAWLSQDTTTATFMRVNDHFAEIWSLSDITATPPMLLRYMNVTRQLAIVTDQTITAISDPSQTAYWTWMLSSHHINSAAVVELRDGSVLIFDRRGHGTVIDVDHFRTKERLRMAKIIRGEEEEDENPPPFLDGLMGMAGGRGSAPDPRSHRPRDVRKVGDTVNLVGIVNCHSIAYHFL